MDSSPIGAENWRQIGLLAAEAIAIAMLLAALFRARRRFGLSPLFATLGVFQYLQVLLAYSLYVEVLPGASISPGSVVLFSGSLFGLLLVFLRESPSETKTLVYGLLAANLSLSAVSLMVSLHLESPLLRNPYQVPEGLFRLDAKIMVVGTLVLVLDMLLMLYFYPVIASRVRSRFVRIAATLCFVLAFDSIVFMTVAFWSQSFYLSALGASVAAKMTVGLIYAGMLTGYLRWVEPKPTAWKLATPAEVLRWSGVGVSGSGHAPVPKDPELGILPAGQFMEVLRQLLALGEQLQSPVAVLSFAIDSGEARLDETERRDLLRYLLAVLRGHMSSKTVFGRHGQSGITAAVASTDATEARKIAQDAHAALAQALTRVRPTKKTVTFSIVIGYAGSPEDGLEPTSLLSAADQRMLSGD